METRYLRASQLATKPASDRRPARPGRYPVSEATIWRWVSQGKFPQPERLSAGVTAWRADVLDRWDAARKAAA
jgi:hypothetical protein